MYLNYSLFGIDRFFLHTRYEISNFIYNVIIYDGTLYRNNFASDILHSYVYNVSGRSHVIAETTNLD